MLIVNIIVKTQRVNSNTIYLQQVLKKDPLKCIRTIWSRCFEVSSGLNGTIPHGTIALSF